MKLTDKRIVIAGTGSGCGKTTVTSGILQCLVNRGISAASFKCGPDYIDPMFHEKVIGTRSGNLDLFFSDEKMLRYLAASASQSCEISVAEGVMGYYDGIGMTDEASTYRVAKALRAPAVLVIGARGMASSVLAVLEGFLHHKPDSGIRGVIFNRLSEKLYSRLEGQVRSLGVEPLGYLPSDSRVEIGSRHLGLVTAGEITDLKDRLNVLAQWMEETVNIDGIVRLAGQADPLEAELPESIESARRRLSEYYSMESARLRMGECYSMAVDCRRTNEYSDIEPGCRRVDEIFSGKSTVESTVESAVLSADAGKEPDSAKNENGQKNEKENRKSCLSLRPKIAVAKDDAFCFTYRANLDLLKELGAELVPFSPISDADLPKDIDGLIISGGYPELYGDALESNVSMRLAVKSAIEGGMPVIAECGGFMYLHRAVEGTEQEAAGGEKADFSGGFRRMYEMAGVFDGECHKKDRLVRFGYIEMTARENGLLAEAGGRLKAHEFHYWDSAGNGSSFLAEKADRSRSWECGISTETMYAGFPHLFFCSSPDAAERFVKKCAEYRRIKKDEI